MSEVNEVREWTLGKFSEVLRVPVVELSPDSRLGVDVDADSVDIVEVANAAEDHFGVVIDEDSLLDVDSIGDLVSLIQAAAT